MKPITVIMILPYVTHVCLDGGVGEKMSIAFSITENTVISQPITPQSLVVTCVISSLDFPEVTNLAEMVCCLKN